MKNKCKKTITKILAFSALFLILPGWVWASLQDRQPEKDQKPVQANKQLLVKHNLASLQLPFIENQGQIEDKSVLYYADTFAGKVAISAKGDIEYTIVNRAQHEVAGKRSLRSANIKRRQSSIFSFKERLVNAEIQHIQGQDASITKVNYFKGKKEDWRTDIPTWQEVGLGEVYNGIRLNLRAHSNNVEKIFTVYPEGSVGDIQLAVEGPQGLTLDSEGNLSINRGEIPVSMTKPVAFQIKGTKKQFVQVAYTISEDSKAYGFTVGKYDKSLPLIIDPFLSYFSYFGTAEDDHGSDIVIDSVGGVWITGTWDHIAPGWVYPPFKDVFVAKLNSSATSLYFITYYGGVYDDTVAGIAADGIGNIYTVGTTESPDFDTLNNTCDGAQVAGSLVYVTKLNESDGSFVHSRCYVDAVGQGGYSYGNGITLDSLHNIYITGSAYSPDFPTTGNYHTIGVAEYETAFVTKLDSSGNIIYSTRIGGSYLSFGTGIAVDGTYNSYVVGWTDSDDFPLLNPVRSTKTNLGFIGFVTKLDPDGVDMGYSTYLGGDDGSALYAIDVDQYGNAYITGNTSGANFPLSTTPYQSSNSGMDAFVTQLDSNGAIVYSTLLGGTEYDMSFDIALDDDGSVYLVGRTNSDDFPEVNGYRGGPSLDYDTFLSKLSPTGDVLLYSTYLGGTAYYDSAVGVAISSEGTVYVLGNTSTSDVVPPDTFTGYQPVSAGLDDAFIAVFEESSGPDDLDGDGDPDSSDCEPTNKFVYHGANELCNGVDDNCDGSIDDGLPQITFYRDADNDGFGGDILDSIQACSAPVGYVQDNTDCDDTLPDGALIYPGVTRQTNCGTGACASTGIETCSDGAWIGDTCVVGTGTTESCNGFDDNCNGFTDESNENINDPLTLETNCGAGPCASTGTQTCNNGAWSEDTCAAGPGIDETCNGVDDDCNGVVDDNLTEVVLNDEQRTICDGSTKSCENGDWENDYSEVTSYEASETNCNDGLDNDCDGDVDADDQQTTCSEISVSITYESNWEPTNNNSTTINAATNAPGNVTYKFSLATLTASESAFHSSNPSQWPGEYTNDSSPDTSDDFTYSVTDLEGDESLTLSSSDYGGSIKLKVEVWENSNLLTDLEFWVPKDSDGDRLPDFWEKLYGTNEVGTMTTPANLLSTTSSGSTNDNEIDIEPSIHTDGTTNPGDGLSNFDEYRGFIWGPKMLGIDPGDSDTVTGDNPYQTTAFVPSSETVAHFRSNPERKDLFIKFENYDYITYSKSGSTFTPTPVHNESYPSSLGSLAFDGAFALGGAFGSVGVDVHPYCMDLAGTPPGETKITAIKVTNELVTTYNEHPISHEPMFHILHNNSPYRLWWWEEKGAYKSAEGAVTYQRSLDAYFDDKPYFDKDTWNGNSWESSDGMLNQLAVVEDSNDDGDLKTNNPQKEEGKLDGGSNGSLDGDHFAKVFGQQLSPFDIDGDDWIENPQKRDIDPHTLTKAVLDPNEHTRPHCLKHTITHELGHAVGMSHDADTACLMSGSSNDWVRDSSFCVAGKNDLVITND